MTEPQEDYPSVFRDLWHTVQTGGSVKAYLRSSAAVPRPVLLLWAAHFCLSELHNGGLLQLFFNSTGVLMPEAIEGFSAIGMPKLSATLTEAAALLGRKYPRDRDERWDALLAAGDLPEHELERIFQAATTAQSFYQGFVEATKALPLSRIEEHVWALADEENGGFQANALRWAHKLRASELGAQ